MVTQKEAKEKAEKEAQEKAEKERIEKERQAQAQEARDRVQFGGGWAEYYRIPDPTGKNDDGQPHKH